MQQQNKKRRLLWYTIIRANAQTLSIFFNEEYIPPNKYRKMFIKKWYLILYQIQEDVVYVDYILDYRKDYQWLDK